MKRGIFRGTASKRRIEKEKNKEKDFEHVTENDGSNALILSLAGSSESWVIDSGASFHATFQHIFQNYVKGELGYPL